MINLTKGENHVIDKNTQTAIVGLGWDVQKGNGQAFDLDASVFLLGADGKMHDEKDFIFFKNLSHPSGAVVHTGDNRTGAGEGDDEQIKIDFSKMPANIEKISVVVNIYEAESRHQNFGQVNNAYVRLVNTTGGKNEEELRFDLTEDYSGSTGIHVVDIYRRNDEWKMKAIGEGAKKDLGGYLAQFKG